MLQASVIYVQLKKTDTMKKFSTLLFAIALFTTAFAQTDAEREEAKRIILGDRDVAASYPGDRTDRDIYSSDSRTVYRKDSRRHPASYGNSRERRIYEINREYDAKIQSVRWSRNLSRYEKTRIMRRLEEERTYRIRKVANSSYGKSRRYDNDDCDNDRYGRNNGRRNGWFK